MITEFLNLFGRKNSLSEFNKWMSRIVIKENPPNNIIAYNVGLIETRSGYSAYFMGSKSYNQNNDDWACDFGDYQPYNMYLNLSRTELKEEKWELIHEKISEYMKSFLKTNEAKTSFLSNAVAITVGFDDGDLERIR